MNTGSIRDKLIVAGVRNLREFGYPSCNDKNIITDFLYKEFFIVMLRDNLGKGYDKQIMALLKECNAVLELPKKKKSKIKKL